MAKHKQFSDLTQEDLDRIDQARSTRSFRAALTKKLETERAQRDACDDLTRELVLGEYNNRDLWAPDVTVTYRKTYRAEAIRLTLGVGI